MQGFFLGVGVAVIQYAWDYSTRVLFPNLADLSLYFYLVAAIVFSTVFILRDAVKQKRMSGAAKSSSSD